MSKEIFRIHSIIVPGVRRDIGIVRKVFQLKKHPQITGVTLFNARWSKPEDYQSKVGRLLDTIDETRKENPHTPVVLFGISAGGAISMNASHERPEQELTKTLISARLRTGYSTLFTQKEVLDHFPSHREAVRVFEEDVEPALTERERTKTLTMIPAIFDEVVPVKSMFLSGAEVCGVPNTSTHTEGIAAVFSTLLQVVLDFAERNAVI